MKINFLGTAGSGKTTTAALVFAGLKAQGYCCEFVTEQARLYIAKAKYGNPGLERLTLTDQDQYNIMLAQQTTETIVSFSVGQVGHVICDSSPINALFYMNSNYRNEDNVQALLASTLGSVGTVFYCKPTYIQPIDDPNRIHSYEQSLAIDAQVASLLKVYAPNLSFIELDGSAEERAAIVTKRILGATCSG